MGAAGAAMSREPGQLTDRRFDLLVVGAGIHGACVARDAAMRGLSVALIDQGDFGGATSHNSLKLIHGGIRYLQHFDIRRVRQSIRERNFWLNCAPHLVRPLKFVIPAYGYGTRGVVALGAATHLHGLLGLGCDKGLPEHHAAPGGGVLSPGGIRQLLPDLDRDGLTGGVFWTDGQMLDANRVLLECVESASAEGAVVCNYVRAHGFIEEGARIVGVIAEDVLDGDEFEIRADHCVNTAGPWINQLLSRQFPQAASRRLAGLSKCINLVTRRVDEHRASECAFGVVSNRSSDSLVGKSRRMFFVTPWRDLSIIGTSHLPFDGNPDELECTASDIETFLEEINAAYPFGLSSDDVRYCHVGLTPAETGLDRGQVKRARHGEIVDHGRADNISGLTSVIGVKYTTARLVAEQAVDLVLRKLGRKHEPCRTADTPLPGAGRRVVSEAAVGDAGCLDGAACLRDLSRHAARCEMAVRLADYVFRRSTLAETGVASLQVLRLCAESMGAELGWSDDYRETEVQSVLSRLPQASSRNDQGASLAPSDFEVDPMVRGEIDEQTDPALGLREGAV